MSSPAESTLDAIRTLYRAFADGAISVVEFERRVGTLFPDPLDETLDELDAAAADELLAYSEWRGGDFGQTRHLVPRRPDWRYGVDSEPYGWIDVPAYRVALRSAFASRWADDDIAAAVQRAFLALRLPVVLSVQLRLLYPNWRTLWRRLADALGESWVATHRASLAIDVRGDAADRAALALFVDLVDRARNALSEEELEVVLPVRAWAVSRP